MNKQFGSGVLFGLPVGGNLAANPTPYRFGVLQEVNVDFKAGNEKLFGQKQFPVAVARSQIELSVKAKLAIIDVNMLNQLYFGQTSGSGMTQIADGEAHNAIAPAQPAAHQTGHAYIVGDLIWDGTNVQKCVTPGNSAAQAPLAWGTVVGAETADEPVVWQCLGPTYGNIPVTSAARFVTDYGVINGITGNPLTKVAGQPASGQYACDGAGNYLFAAGDAGTSMLISYTYTVTTGSSITVNNELMGHGPIFRAFLYNSFDGDFIGLELFACKASDISIPTKQKGFWIVDFNFDAFADVTDAVCRLCAS